MRVAITGGAGFIGTPTKDRLHEAGHDVTIIDRAAGIDVRDAAAIHHALAGCDAVIHMAGVLGTHELFDHAATAIAVNVTGTLNVLEAAVAHDVAYVGITMPAVFPSVYTATKIGARHLERAWHHTYGLPVARVRAFNAYGPGQAHGPGHPQKILPTFAVHAWAGRPLPIWGDGTQTVDLVHADDLARQFVDLVEHPEWGDDFTVDGGTGSAFTVKEVADWVNVITGNRAGVEYLPMRRGELPTAIVADGEGWDRLGWSPHVHGFEDAVCAYRTHPAVETLREAAT